MDAQARMDRMDRMDAQPHAVLCVGDEVEMLTALDHLFQEEEFQFFTAFDSMEAVRLLREHDIHLVISGQRIAGAGENLFLKRVASEFPDTLRAILTGYSEVDLAGRLIRLGHIDMFFLRPWYDEKLKWEIRHTLEQYALIQENKRLLKVNHDQEAVIRHLENRLIESACIGSRAEDDATLSRAIIEQLPMPVIGIGGDQKIILANRQAQSLPSPNDPLSPGRRVCEFFPDSITGRITVAMHTRTVRVLNRRPLWGGLYDLSCIPLDMGSKDMVSEKGVRTSVLLLHRIR